jgi:S-(hydroxymethyl)glutathione dehydrogenase / alcohol dehydrogenase
MKAAVCYDFGKPLVVEEVTLDAPQEGEVRVKIAATGICHSDLHLIAGEWGGPTPVVAGHESAGTVLEVGPAVTRYKAGDRVLVTLIRSCGRCFYCEAGHPQRCETLTPLDRSSRLRNAQGVTLRHGLRTASFAEEVVVDASQLVALPADLPLDVAALLACAVITGAGAVLNTAEVKAGRSVVVIGTGGVGLNSIQGARIAGAYPIVAVDLLEAKLESARKFGATHAVNPETDDPVKYVKALTAGRGADYVFVTVGNAKASEQAFAMLRSRGLQVIVGIPAAGSTAAFPVLGLVQERMVTGSTMGSTRLQRDVPALINLYRSKQLLLDELITERFPLARINEAIAHTTTGAALRNIIVF